MTKKHVPDLELCQELDRLCKEKGIVVPETEFYWVSYGTPYVATKTARSIFYDHTWAKHSIPAPLVSEQGEWLPRSVKKDGDVLDLWCVKLSNDTWAVCFKFPNGDWSVYDQEANTEANARQKMINYLIAEGIITKL